MCPIGRLEGAEARILEFFAVADDPLAAPTHEPVDRQKCSRWGFRLLLSTVLLSTAVYVTGLYFVHAAASNHLAPDAELLRDRTSELVRTRGFFWLMTFVFSLGPVVLAAFIVLSRCGGQLLVQLRNTPAIRTFAPVHVRARDGSS